MFRVLVDILERCPRAGPPWAIPLPFGAEQEVDLGIRNVDALLDHSEVDTICPTVSVDPGEDLTLTGVVASCPRRVRPRPPGAEVHGLDLVDPVLFQVVESVELAQSGVGEHLGEHRCPDLGDRTVHEHGRGRRMGQDALQCVDHPPVLTPVRHSFELTQRFCVDSCHVEVQEPEGAAGICGSRGASATGGVLQRSDQGADYETAVAGSQPESQPDLGHGLKALRVDGQGLDHSSQSLTGTRIGQVLRPLQQLRDDQQLTRVDLEPVSLSGRSWSPEARPTRP